MFILLNWVKYYTKETTKALKIISIGTMLILSVVFIKYKPAYAVTLAGQELGYVKNKEKLEVKIQNYIEDTSGNVAFREQLVAPEYKLKLVDKNKRFEEKQVQLAIEMCKLLFPQKNKPKL